MNTITQTTDLQKLIDGLNKDLAYEYAAVIQYIYNASVVTGLSRQILKPYFEAEAKDELNHASFLAEKVTHLGGTPEVQPAQIKQFNHIREMLQHALNQEVDTIERYKARIVQAEQIGEIGLKIKLEDMIADETNHKEELERLLQDPRL